MLALYGLRDPCSYVPGNVRNPPGKVNNFPARSGNVRLNPSIQPTILQACPFLKAGFIGSICGRWFTTPAAKTPRSIAKRCS